MFRCSFCFDFEASLILITFYYLTLDVFCCLVSLIIALIAFIMDIRLSLLALKLEMGDDEHSGTAT